MIIRARHWVYSRENAEPNGINVNLIPNYSSMVSTYDEYRDMMEKFFCVCPLLGANQAILRLTTADTPTKPKKIKKFQIFEYGYYYRVATIKSYYG